MCQITLTLAQSLAEPRDPEGPEETQDTKEHQQSIYGEWSAPGPCGKPTEMSQHKKMPPQNALQTKGSYCIQEYRTCYQMKGEQNFETVKFAIRHFVEMCDTSWDF